MLSSTPAYIKCYQCRKSPKSFTFLLCNHIICENCISNKIQITERYNLVKCTCGCLTYFNQDSQIVQQQQIRRYDKQKVSNNKEYIQNNKIKQPKQLKSNNKSLNNSHNIKSKSNTNINTNLNNNSNINNQRRSMIDNRNSYNSYNNKNKNSYNNNKSNQLIDQYSKTLINERSTMPMLEVSQVFSLQKNQSSSQSKYNHNHNNNNNNDQNNRPQSPHKQRYLNGSLLPSELRQKLNGTQKTKYDQSLLLQNYNNFYNQTNHTGNKQFKDNKQPKVINQFSTHQINNNNQNNNNNQTNDNNNQFQKQQQQKQYRNNFLRQVKNINQSLIIPTSNNKHNIKQNIISSNNILNKQPLHSQFQNQIGFLKIIFQKDIEQIQFQFQKVINYINNIYSQLQSQLRSLYIEEVITKQSLISLNLSSLIRNKYDKSIGQKFKFIKNQLLTSFYHYKHNQKISFVNNSQYNSPLIQAYKLKSKLKSPTNDSINQSQFVSDNQNQDCQEITMKNKKIPPFQTVQEKLQRMTTKQQNQPRKSRNNRTDHVKLYNEDSSKRIQTQNIHTSVKRSGQASVSHKQKQKNDHSRQSYHSPQQKQHYRLTEKPYKRSSLMQDQSQTEHKRRQIIYYSPPLPYCYKHLQKKEKQARNYISYIEKLCHEKKMKNNQQLFKKVKNGQGYEFNRIRD